MCNRFRALQLALSMALLCACSPDESPYKGSNLIRVIPGGRSLSVVGAKTESEAQPWATEYCTKQGLSPRFRGMGMRWRSTTAEYECVA
jgi:hypothetical protein